jgi:hypothetical protein
MTKIGKDGPADIAAEVLTPERAEAVHRWRFEHGMTLEAVAALGSSWHMPDDTSPWFGVHSFGAALVAESKKILGKDKK